METEQRMAQAFDGLAGDYDDAYHDEVAAALVRLVAPASTASVADVACGTGAVSLALARARPAAAPAVLAIDISPGMVATGRARALRDGTAAAIDWRVGPAVPLPVPDASLDVVLCASSLHFLGAWALRDWRRALRPAGRCGFSLPVASSFRPGGVFAELVAGDLRLPETGQQARATAQAAGFLDVTVRTVTAGHRRVFLVAATNPAE